MIARRGEVYDVTFPAPIGRRPAIIVTRNEAIAVRTSLTVVPVTSTVRGLRVEVPLGTECGLDHDSAANCDNVATVRVQSFGRRRGELGPAEIRALDRALQVALALD